MHAKQGTLRRIVDPVLTVLLLLLMSFQVTGQLAHEWLGMAMTALVILHQILNRRWYKALFTGRCTAQRAVSTAVNALLLISFGLTAFCGMAMSSYAVPFLYGIARTSFVRRMHLSMSHWSFVLMGLHLGLHVPAMLAALRLSPRAERALSLCAALVAGVGLWLFLKSGMPDCLFFRVSFAFLDYDKAWALVLLEHLAMLIFWAFAGSQLSRLLRGRKEALRPALMLVLALAVGLILNAFLQSREEAGDFGWSAPVVTAAQTEEPRQTLPEDGFVLLPGGTFTMGSPETENWRIGDEAQRTVTVAAFWIDPYETTQARWEAVMGDNPSTFTGDVAAWLAANGLPSG